MAEASTEDLTCSVCLDVFTEPVLLACGHCFCRPCIASFWHSPARAASCPECRAPCPDRKYTPSRLLGSLAQRARQLLIQQEEAGGGATEEKEGEGGKGDSKLRCEVHGDMVGLFCLTDEAPVCYSCVGSPAHAGHSFISVQDGAQKCKEKLAQWLESLEVRVQTLENLERRQDGYMVSLRDSTEELRVNIEAKFSELQQFLSQKKDMMLAELEKEEKDAHNHMETRLRQIQEGLSSAMDLKSQGRALMERKNPTVFLSDIQPFLHIMTEGDEDSLYPFSALGIQLCLGRFKGPIQHLAFTALCSVFKLGLEPIQLDPETSHPVFIIYKNTHMMTQWKSNIYNNNPERFENYPMVLGKRGFCSGEHYWEIETKDAAGWAIGVATESIERKVQVSIQDFIKKVWVLKLATVKNISPEDGTLVQRFGVYLDYDKGQISFYDVKSYSHLCTHQTQFKEKVYPVFWNITKSEKSVSLSICHKQDM
ncbi:zinc-binding protein A33-like [Heteronotia binoei]|uniref:zinc-binding protein A33-like n=1 Tax=Heteronotia binoei TaxID=13085 RepID=UPI002930EEB0|nr:zinc-binding protein A33-like [Heteronotia binoei]